MTGWKSNTCKCIIIFSDDEIKITEIINECKKHHHTVGENFKGCESQKYNSDINRKYLKDNPEKNQTN